jgi:hypothetical protein
MEAVYPTNAIRDTWKKPLPASNVDPKCCETLPIPPTVTVRQAGRFGRL